MMNFDKVEFAEHGRSLVDRRKVDSTASLHFLMTNLTPELLTCLPTSNFCLLCIGYPSGRIVEHTFSDRDGITRG
jgi:hypothetical protein